MNYTFDTSVIIKGLLKPRRRKQDSIFKEQERVHKIASTLMDKVYNKEINMFIPTAAIIEISCVASKLTGIETIGIEIAEFVTDIAAEIINERRFIKEFIDMAAKIKISGFDSVFITCAKLTNSILITDDKKMYDSAIKLGIRTELLRNIK